MKRIGIFGTSGMAREAGDVACELGYAPVYVARDQVEMDAWAFPEDVVLEKEVRNHCDMPYVIGIGDNSIRAQVARRFESELRFVTLIHPSATFGQGQRRTVEACRGVIVSAGVRFTNSIQVGDFCIFNQNATIAHDVVVEDFVHVAPGANISGNVQLGARCWVGAGAVVNQGSAGAKLCIGAGAVVGSGAVVVRACEAGAVYAGVPAKRIK